MRVDAIEHGDTTRWTILPYRSLRVDIALHDGVIGGAVDTIAFLSEEGRLEENFGASEALVTDVDQSRKRQHRITEFQQLGERCK